MAANRDTEPLLAAHAASCLYPHATRYLIDTADKSTLSGTVSAVFRQKSRKTGDTESSCALSQLDMIPACPPTVTQSKG
jgi:hypothetical protein